MKLHVALDHQGNLPAFAAITHSHTSDLEVARSLNFPKGSLVTCDRGYLDYAWFKTHFQSRSIITTNTETSSVEFIYEARLDGTITG